MRFPADSPYRTGLYWFHFCPDGIHLRCPDYTSVSKRAKSFDVSFKTPSRGEIAHLVCLQVYLLPEQWPVTGRLASNLIYSLKPHRPSILTVVGLVWCWLFNHNAQGHWLTMAGWFDYWVLFWIALPPAEISSPTPRVVLQAVKTEERTTTDRMDNRNFLIWTSF